MGSALLNSLLVIVTQSDGVGASPSPPTSLQYLLGAFDWGLAGLALLVLAWFAVTRARGVGGDVLACAPVRMNRVREDAVALVIVSYLAAAMILSSVVRAVLGEEPSAVSMLVIGTGAHLVGIAACVTVAGGRFDGGARRFLFGVPGVPGCLRLTAILTVLALGLVPLIHFGTVEAIRYFVPGYEPANHPTITALRDPGQSMCAVVLLWISAAAVAPVAEELFFRGLMQTLLVNLTGSRWAAIALASAAFGAVHFQQGHAVAALALLAAIMGLAYERTGTLVYPILIHAAFNLKTLVWEALGGAAV